MRYYLDCEFDGYGGDLISLALVRDDGASLYLVFEGYEDASEPWVRENVLPIVPLPIAKYVARGPAQTLLWQYLAKDPDPVIITDWPDDVSYFATLLLTGPGTMIGVPSVKFEVHRVDAYPTDLPGAVQHNAWWDAQALRRALSSAKQMDSESSRDALNMLSDEAAERGARAWDAEDAAQMGEPSPWDNYDPKSDDNEFRMCRIACFRAAFAAAVGGD